MKTLSCFVCGKNNWKKHFKNLLKCQHCSFIRADDKFFKFDPQILYSKKYFTKSYYADYLKEKEALLRNFNKQLSRIMKLKESGKLLEIGCAFGYFLQLAEKHYDTYGIDLNPEVTAAAKKNAPKSRIFTGDFLSTFPDHPKFDIVCMFDVIEHLKEPGKYLKKIASLTRQRGILVIETGDICSKLARLQGKHWRLIKPPVHLSYFSQESLGKLLENYGFKVLKIEYPGTYRSLRQTLTYFKFPTFASQSQLLNKSLYLNTKDIMLFTAQKE